MARLAARDVGLLGVILVGALGVRLLGVGRGLPYLHEWDEPTVLSYVIGMLQRGDLYPNAFVYPSVYYYMLLPVTYLHYAYLYAHGALASPWDIQRFHPQAAPGAYWWYLNPASFYLWARTLTALIGTATVYLVYRIGKTVYGTTAGLLAAAFLALAPGAVYYSDTVTVDIPMVFFVTLTVLAGLGIIRRGRWQDYILTGLLAGLSISTKQNAVMVVLPLVVAHLVSAHRTRLVDLRMAVMGLCVLLGFTIGTPYVLIKPALVLGQLRGSALVYAGVPSLTSMQQVLPRYLAYFVRPTQDTWFVIPHAAMGLLPAVSALLGAVVGFRWDRRLHLYLLSFPLPYFLFISGQHELILRSMMAVLPFMVLFAAAGCIWVWGLLPQIRWPAADASWTRGLAGLALVALIAAPGRDAAVLGWTMGDHPDTRTAAVDWLRLHVTPGTRIALEKELRWFIPDLDRLPFVIRFVPRDTPLAWYLQEHIDFAAVGDRSPLRSLLAVAAFPQPPYLRAPGSETWPQDGYPVIDPTLYIVRPRMQEINAVFPAAVDSGDMIPEPIVTNAVGVYSETVRLPDQRFAPGSYALVLTAEWPRLWASLNFTLTKLTVKVQVGQMTVGTVTVAGTQPLGFSTPTFRIEQAQTLPVKVELVFWIRQPRTPGQQDRAGWALRPSTTCAIVPAASKEARRLDVQQMTLEAWVYPEGMTEPPGMRSRGLESEGPILGKRRHEGYYLRLVGDTSDRIFADLSVAGKFSVGRAGFVPFRKWTHIAATYDGHEARIYLNGVPAAPSRDPHHAGPVRATDAPLIIGCRNPGGPDQAVFKGLITGVRIWNRVLPPEDLRIEAGPRPLPATSTGLVGSWSFQSLVGGMVPDLSEVGNNLTATALQRVPVDSNPPARPVWTSGQLNLLRTVTIRRVTP